MAILKGGPNGPFSGKVGSVVGSNWRDIDYIKGRSRRSKRKPSEAQLRQRQRFPEVTIFLYPLKDAINKGWNKQKKTRGTAVNDAVSYNSKYALHPDSGEIMFSRVKLSDGALPKPVDARAERTAPETIRINWNSAFQSFNTSPQDEATIAIVFPALGDTIVWVGQYSRFNGEAVISNSAIKKESVCHAFIFFTSPKGISSPTFYMRVAPMEESENEHIELGQEDNSSGNDGEKCSN